LSKVKFWFVALLLILANLWLDQLGTFASGKQASISSEAFSNIDFRPYPPLIHPVRIGLACRSASSYVVVWSPGAVFVDEKPVFALAPQRVYRLQNGRITELASGKSYQLPLDRRAHITASDYQVWTNNRWYGGCLELIRRGNRITVINLLDLEDYLRGVVPAEMPAKWHLEALKAQAVAARSYAYAHIGSGSKWYHSEGYDLVPDVRDQAYKGLAVAASSSDWAIKLTHGIVLKDSGRIKPGFYRAWVGDDFENLNMRRSVVSNSVLEKITAVPKIVGVTVKQWDSDGNANSLQVIGAKKSREVSGIALAKLLHFSTAGILDAKQQGDNWIFTYRGPGNGSRGLSQHGANTLASRGWPYAQILQQYYQDPDGHLRLAYLEGYYYGDERLFKRREIEMSKIDSQKNNKLKTQVSETEKPNKESKVDESKLDEHNDDNAKTDTVKTDDAKTADSKTDNLMNE